jgi:DHA1 family inner membrane transport protein
MQSSFNIANALGSALGGLVLAAGPAYAAPPAVGAVLAAIVVAIAFVVHRQARAGERSAPVPAPADR